MSSTSHRTLDHVARTAPVGNRNPAQHLYQKLVAELATNLGDQGLYDVKQLRSLSHAERATVLRANPDVINWFAFDPQQMADVLDGGLDARLWFSVVTESALRRWLFEDVKAEITRDEAILDESARDPELRKADFL